MTKYNGWTNWETWQVPLWIDNDEGTYRTKREALRRYRSVGIDNISARHIAEGIFPDGTPDMEPGDMDKVDWAEIAEHWEDERQEMLEDGA